MLNPQTKTEVTSEMQAAVEKWNSKYSNEPGYRSGSTYAPEQMRETIEISSALQLPSVLAKLHGPDASNIRLRFPQPAQGLSDDERAAIRAEQTAIHKFLQNSHGKDLSQLLGEVKGLIENSSSFARDKNSGLLQNEMTADQWIQATVGEKLGQIEKYPQKLDVSDVIELGSKNIETVKTSLEVALKEAVKSSRGLIITIPDTTNSTDKREQLKGLLSKFVEERKNLPDFSEDDLAKIKVWAGPSKNNIMAEPAAGQPCSRVKEISLVDFLKDEEPRLNEGETAREIEPTNSPSTEKTSKAGEHPDPSVSSQEVVSNEKPVSSESREETFIQSPGDIDLAAPDATLPSRTTQSDAAVIAHETTPVLTPETAQTKELSREQSQTPPRVERDAPSFMEIAQAKVPQMRDPERLRNTQVFAPETAQTEELSREQSQTPPVVERDVPSFADIVKALEQREQDSARRQRQQELEQELRQEM